MPLMDPMQVARWRHFSFRSLMVWLAMGSLAIALAHRTFHVSSTVTLALQSNARDAKIQHLADDAHYWTLPSAGFLLLLLSGPSPHIAREQRPHVPPNRDGWINDRPPPVR